MSSWRDLSKDAWSFTTQRMVGIGGGIGPHKIAYAINQAGGLVLNGKIEADIKFLTSGLAAAGLVCRADEHWTFLAFYALHNPNADATVMGLGLCDKGSFRPIFALKEKILLDDGYNRFSLEFFSGQVVGRIVTTKKEYQLVIGAPHVAFPGYVGLVKLYGSEVVVKNFQAQEKTAPAEAKEGSVYKYDVFISHSSEDNAVVKQITADFRNEGVKYWVDAEQINYGSVIEQIENGLQNSKHILVCVSSHLGKSNWCRAEYGVVLHKYFSKATNKRVIPLTLDNSTDDDIPLLLYDLKRVNYLNKSEFQDLISYLKS